MKFFFRLFLSMMLILTAALSAAEYYTVSESLENAVDRQIESCLRQHELAKYAIRSGMITASRSSELDRETIDQIARQTAQTSFSSLTVADSKKADEAAENTLSYVIDENHGSPALTVSSVFTQSGFSLSLTTRHDISPVFQESFALQKRFQQIFLIITLLGAAVSLLISSLLTAPVRKLKNVSSAFAAGDYSARLHTRSKDELGELSRTFNAMAQTIQDKIDDLELSVKKRDDFAASFAHELKTPMTSIIGYADMINQKPLSKEQIHEASGYILGEAMRLEALSFKLLELVTLEKQNYILEDTDSKAVFSDIEDTILPLAAKRKVKISFSCERAYIRVELDLFKTMLLNLLDNALKSGGSAVKLSGRLSGSLYLVSVADNGRGFPEAELERIKEAFYMVDKSRSRKEHGAGLGLALCDKIALIHGSHLTINSIEGVGTLVELSVPASGKADEDDE